MPRLSCGLRSQSLIWLDAGDGLGSDLVASGLVELGSHRDHQLGAITRRRLPGPDSRPAVDQHPPSRITGVNSAGSTIDAHRVHRRAAAQPPSAPVCSAVATAPNGSGRSSIGRSTACGAQLHRALALREPPEPEGP